MKKHLLTSSTILMSVFLATSPLTAQKPQESIYAPCAQIADDVERLACFDQTYREENQILAAKQEEERQETVDNFGLSATQQQERAEAEGDEVVAENGQISAVVSDIYSNRRTNKRIFVLDNGQIWRETQVSRMQRNPRVGQNVTISEASFGGYRLRVDGKQGFVAVLRVK